MSPYSQKELTYKMKWLMFLRVLFAILLLGSTIIIQLAQNLPYFSMPLVLLYGMIIGIFILTIIYAVKLVKAPVTPMFAFCQISLDTILVSMIIFITGGYNSIFSFLYLLVVIYTSIILYRRASLFIAGLSGFLYFLIVNIEYYQVLLPPIQSASMLAHNYTWIQVHYKILMTAAACLTVALLSNFLTEQTRRTQKKLNAMEAQVRRVEKLAAVGEMAAGLAHEIKNPLASLVGSIQILKEDLQYDSDHDRLMTIILREADRMGALLNSFLLFARPPVGKIERLALAPVLKETISLFSQNHRLSERIVIDDALIDDIYVEMDPSHLNQILWNLLLNATEAIRDKGTISVRMNTPSPDVVTVDIADNGCGIAENDVKTIFDPFITTKASGTGLGLSIVHSILDSYKGELNVESELGAGSIFTIKLNRAKVVPG